MFLKKLLILVCLFGFSTTLFAEAERQQYDYLTYTINVENTSGVAVNVKAQGNNTNLSTVTFEGGNSSIDTNGQLPIANAKDAVNDTSGGGGAFWTYMIYASDNSFICKIQVNSLANSKALQTNTGLENSNPSMQYCKLKCDVGCNSMEGYGGSFTGSNSQDNPYKQTFTLTISKP